MGRHRGTATSLVTLMALLALTTWGAGCAANEGAKPTPAARERKAAGAPATYYVSPGGSDSNRGTREAPWASPGYGSKQIRAGDTLVILGGRYSLSVFEDDMITPPSGAEGAWTTVTGEAGARPVLAGSDDLYSAVDISGKSFVRLENLEITSDGGAKFRGGVAGSGDPVSHIVLKDLYIHHIDEGAVDIADADDLRVENCVMTHCGFGCLGGPVGTAGGWRNVVVAGCTLSYSGHYYQGGPGPSPYDRPDGFGVEPSEGPIEIAGTRAEHNRGDGLDSKCANTYIHDCVVANNSCDGVKLWDHDCRVVNTLIYGTGDGVGGGSPWAGIVLGGSRTRNARFELTNVTLHDNPRREAYSMYMDYEGSTPMTLVMRNTTVSNAFGVVYLGDGVDLVAEHNNFYRPGEAAQVYLRGKEYTASEIERGVLGEGNMSRDPLFDKPAWGEAGDYHLKAGSPLIDAGTSQGAPATDLDGDARPAGKAYDIGAYEYGSKNPEPPPPASGKRTWGTDSIGASAPSREWYLAEGCTAGHALDRGRRRRLPGLVGRLDCRHFHRAGGGREVGLRDALTSRTLPLRG